MWSFSDLFYVISYDAVAVLEFIVVLFLLFLLLYIVLLSQRYFVCFKPAVKCERS